MDGNWANVSKAQNESRKKKRKNFTPSNLGTEQVNQKLCFRRCLKGNCIIYDGAFKPLKSTLPAGAVGGITPWLHTG